MDDKIKTLNSQNSERGMSLLEVMIAMTIFAFFAVVFSNGITYNIFSSIEIKEELKVVELAELKINELIVSPPDLKGTLLEASKDTKTFDDYPAFSYTVTIKKFVIPDLAKLQGKEENGDEDGQNAAIQKRVFKEIKTNMEKLIWQLNVEVIHKESGRKHNVSTWLFNHNATVKIGGF